MAWDGYRLPSFTNVVRRKVWGTDPPNYVGLDVNALPEFACQLYWGVKRGFRLPVSFVPTIPGQFPMMIKAPWGSGIVMDGVTGPTYGDWFVWSFTDQVYMLYTTQVGAVSLGNPNQYEGALGPSFQVDWVGLGWTLPAGWPLP